MDNDSKLISKRLQLYRERSDKSVAEVAAAVGIPFESYVDLEMQDNEIFDAISLQHLAVLARTLDFKLLDLFTNAGSPPSESITLEQLADKIKQYVADHDISIRQFEDRVGWEVERALKDPTEFLNLTVTALMDICRELNVSWLSVLSTL